MGDTEENEYEPVGFNTSQSEINTSSGQPVARPRPRPNRSTSEQSGRAVGNLISFYQENEENDRRLVSNEGEVYEPVWMGHSPDHPIRGTNRHVSSPSGGGGSGSGPKPDTTGGAGATGGVPLIPPKQKTRTVSTLETGTNLLPSTDIPSLPAPRYQRATSQQEFATPLRPPRSVRDVQSGTSNEASENMSSPMGAVGGRRSLPPLTPSPGAVSPVVSDDPFPMSPGYDLSSLPEKMRESMGVSDGVGGWNVPPEDETGAPPPYIPRNAFSRGAQKSLKLSQVEVLQKEMSHSGGVKVMLRRTDCFQTIAFIDYKAKVWIAGWNQKARPFLHSAFHVGDRLVCINGQVIENCRMARKLIKHCSEDDKLTFIIRRIPHGKIFAIRRSEDGESLGIRREGGTGEIIDVEPFGLAARNGLTVKAQAKDGTNMCNWFLTEINSRPVNLFYKGDEIERRLKAVGKDISFLVQPTEFIDVLKREMKANFKNYKDFIVQ